MLSPTHLAGGFIVLSMVRPIVGRYVDFRKASHALLVTGLLLSLTIDLDGLWIAHPNHHLSVLHYPLFWLVISLIIVFAGLVARLRVLQALAIVVLVSSMTHLFQDTFGVTMGIFWLWPISMHEFSFLPLHPLFDNLTDWFFFYIKQPIMILEVVIVLCACFIWFFQQKSRQGQVQ